MWMHCQPFHIIPSYSPAPFNRMAYLGFRIEAGTRHGRRACCLLRPGRRNLYVKAKGPNTKGSLFEMNQTISALRDAPCTHTPHPASSNLADTKPRKADQLAELALSPVEGLRQGSPIDKGVRPRGPGGRRRGGRLHK